MFKHRRQAQGSKNRVLLAAGGTGGHLFPAQRLAKDLQVDNVEVLFAGSGLKANPFFYRDRFPFVEIRSSTPFGKGFYRLFSASLPLISGIVQSMKVLSDFQPGLVVGFGSFHAFPILMAAKIKRIPYVLFESNSFPGKVNRFFSKGAKISAIQFAESAKKLHGLTVEVNMPLWKERNPADASPKSYFGLDPSLFTFLIFGGSQGAAAINAAVCSALPELVKRYPDIQVIHISGSMEQSEKMQSLYDALNIRASVKKFEEKMHLAWESADLVICRAGAVTLAEQIAYEVPGILIPWGGAADQHQKKNAAFMAGHIQGAIDLSEKDLDAPQLLRAIDFLLSSDGEALKKMKEAIRQFKQRKERKDLSSEILALLGR